MDLVTLFTILGVAITAFVMLLGVMNAWVSMQAKMDMIVTVLGEIKANLIDQKSDIKNLEHRVTKIEEHILRDGA